MHRALFAFLILSGLSTGPVQAADLPIQGGPGGKTFNDVCAGEAKGWTQEGLAKRAKVARSYVAKLEAGHGKNPSPAVLQRLARALGVPVAALME